MTEDLDELLNAAFNGPDEEPETDVYRREVKSYINMVGLKDGINSIPFTILYEHFQKQFPKTEIGPKIFNRIFQEFFPYRRTSRGRYYKLDAVALGLPMSYSYYQDKRFYPKSSRKKKKHAKEVEQEKQEAEEQKYYQKLLEDASRGSEDSEK